MQLSTLIEKCLQNDPAAQKELYFTYAKFIYGLCRRYTSDDHQAKDYVQESFHKIFLYLNRFDAEKGAFEAWASTITINTILSDKQKKAPDLRYEDFDRLNQNRLTASANFEVSKIIGYDISAEELLAAIRTLPEDYQLVLNLAIFENWSHDAIAIKMGIQESSSRSKLTRAKQLLKKKLIKKIPSRYAGVVEKY